MGEAPGIGLALAGLAQLAAERGAHQQAADLSREALLALGSFGDPQALVNVGETVAVLEATRPGARADGAVLEHRARALGAVDNLRELMVVPRAASQQPRWERATAAVRTALSDPSFAAAYAAGRQLGADATLAELLALLEMPEPADAPPQPREQPPDPLSRREREIAALIARGYTSKEIAETLVISERTADAHADHIRTKLGLRSRAEIAAWAAEHGLRDTKTPAP
jgi:non-specific serine/threonine protein kinase